MFSIYQISQDLTIFIFSSDELCAIYCEILLLILQFSVSFVLLELSLDIFEEEWTIWWDCIESVMYNYWGLLSPRHPKALIFSLCASSRELIILLHFTHGCISLEHLALLDCAHIYIRFWVYFLFSYWYLGLWCIFSLFFFQRKLKFFTLEDRLCHSIVKCFLTLLSIVVLLLFLFDNCSFVRILIRFGLQINLCRWVVVVCCRSILSSKVFCQVNCTTWLFIVHDLVELFSDGIHLFGVICFLRDVAREI
mgnify:CR=1 FL=1